MEKDIERKYVKDIMEYFKEHKLDEEDKEILRHAIKEIFRIEITQIDAAYNPDKEPNYIILKFINDEKKSRARGFC